MSTKYSRMLLAARDCRSDELARRASNLDLNLGSSP